jgi:hypothetical protein
MVLSSNLTGKYTFAAISLLLFSYVIRFEFGELLMTWVTVSLLGVSLVNYSRVFRNAVNTGDEPVNYDTLTFRVGRLVTSAAIGGVYTYRLIHFLF